MVLTSLCERIGSALLGIEHPNRDASCILPTKSSPSAPAPDRRSIGSLVRLASRAQRDGRLAGPTPRRMSPRQMADLSQCLRDSGLLNADESRLLGFHVELHQDHDATIGAISGSPASPNRPRDLIVEWEERLAFTRAHLPDDRERIRRIERIIDVLRALAEDASVALRAPSPAR
jgi:hypothetical protein